VWGEIKPADERGKNSARTDSVGGRNGLDERISPPANRSAIHAENHHFCKALQEPFRRFQAVTTNTASARQRLNPCTRTVDCEKRIRGGRKGKRGFATCQPSQRKLRGGFWSDVCAKPCARKETQRARERGDSVWAGTLNHAVRNQSSLSAPAHSLCPGGETLRANKLQDVYEHGSFL